MSRDPRSERHLALMREFADTQAEHYPACVSGPCDQGRKPCPSPVACRRPESTADQVLGIFANVRPSLICALIVAVVLGIAYLGAK